MRAAIIGASGFIGQALWTVGSERGHRLYGTYVSYHLRGLDLLDATDGSAVSRYLEAARPEWVLMTAANPNVERCETDPAGTRLTNVEAVRVVAEACRNFGCSLCFFSSDYVFDGTAGPYTEHDLPNPVCEYGRQKLEAEQIIQGCLPGAHLIARVTVVYGWESRGKNFAARLLASLRRGEKVKVPVDQIGSPTLVEDLADAVWSLVEGGRTGIFHVAGSTLISRYKFAVALAEHFALPTDLVVPVRTAALGQVAPRPLQAGMLSQRAEVAIGRRILGVEAGAERLKATESKAT